MNKANDASARLLDWARLRVQLVWAYEGKPLSYHYRVADPANNTAWFLSAGHVTIETTDRPVRVYAGQWVFLPADKIGHTFSANARILSLRFFAHWPNGTPLYRNDRAILIPAHRLPEMERAARVLASAVRRMFPGLSLQYELPLHDTSLTNYAKIEQITWRWFRAYAQAMDELGVERNLITRSDPRVSNALLILDRFAAHDALDESQLAAQVGLSVSQLNRLFATQVGLTPRAYFQNRRLDLAKQALLSMRLPVKQVAHLLGFRHPSHFCRWFGKLAGSSPGALQRGKVHPSQVVR